jgi:K+-transporting ATPase c subunit
MTEPIAVFVTKFALTKGIIETQGVVQTDINESMISVQSLGQCFHKNQWFRTREEAVARAEQLRAKKIASLQKQIAALMAKSF